jgi:hypothetical protein
MPVPLFSLVVSGMNLTLTFGARQSWRALCLLSETVSASLGYADGLSECLLIGVVIGARRRF